jgi:alanine dehydrogenase
LKIGVAREIKNNENRVALTPPVSTGCEPPAARSRSRPVPGSKRPRGRDLRPTGATIALTRTVFAKSDLVLKVRAAPRG